MEWASLLYRMDWEALYGASDGIKCRSVSSALTGEELQALLAGLNIDPDTARGQVVAFAISCQGHFVYGQPSSLRGGPGNASVGMNLELLQLCAVLLLGTGAAFYSGQYSRLRAYRRFAGNLPRRGPAGRPAGRLCRWR